MNRNLSYPSPGEYNDWRSWAASLISVLSAQQEGGVNLPLYVKNEQKARSGYPVAADGDIIRILEDGVIKLKCWNERAKAWEDL